MSSDRDPTVVVAGLGDLGGRVLHLLAGSPQVHRLVGWGAPSALALSRVGQAGLLADVLGGPRSVEHDAIDLRDERAVADALSRTAPDVVVFAASRHTWWRVPPAAAALPYGVWLPLQVSLMRTLMRAHHAVGSEAVVVALPYPDVVGPVLAAQGLAPHAGAGNVSEVAAKLRLVAAQRYGRPREQVEVRLVLHHAAERLAFELFEAAPAGVAADPATPTQQIPPYLAQVTVEGHRLPDDVVDRMLRAPYPLPPGSESHQLTAATVTSLVAALLGDRPRLLHVPAPGGLPGGYPVEVSRGTIELALPEGMGRHDAVRTNECAAAFDGISSIDDDGTVHFTEAARHEVQQVLGVTLGPLTPGNLESVADELAEARGGLEQDGEAR